MDRVFKAVWFTGEYPERQKKANRHGCVGYVEGHFNAREYDKPGFADNPITCLVAHNASEMSVQWAQAYTRRIEQRFDFPNGGVRQLEYRARGDYNLRFTRMPAILVEPLWISDPEQAEIAMSEDGQNALAAALVRSIIDTFPGGDVGFSIGHAGKRRPDPGAPARGHNGEIVAWEADLSEAVLTKAAVLLSGQNSEAFD